MKSYKDFLKTKQKKFISSGFKVEKEYLNKNLFDFQKDIVQIACNKGRFEIFADCGLGKTLMQLEWAYQVYLKTKKKTLILAPLAVVEQTKREAEKFGIDKDSFFITNYDQLKNIDISNFGGIVLDESSILKGRGRKTSSFIIDIFKEFKYKLCCTATPSPNDHMELGQHSEFLGAMSYLEMLAMFFVHDAGQTQKWRLRKYAKDDFWKYVCTWSISVDNPKTMGYEMDGFILPEIKYIEHIIPMKNESGLLFNDVSVSATDLHHDLRKTEKKRIEKVSQLVNNSDEQWIIWTLKNDEAKQLKKVIQNSENVQGSDNPQKKAEKLNGFSQGEFQNLITKTSLASFGLNYQNCHNMVFMSYDFKFEAFYQAVRRSYRFGQKHKVKVHLLIPESQKNVRKSILEKQDKHFKMIAEMSKYSKNTDYKTNVSKVKIENKEIKTKNYHIMNGDC